jgi:hypothetical protein
VEGSRALSSAKWLMSSCDREGGRSKYELGKNLRSNARSLLYST